MNKRDHLIYDFISANRGCDADKIARELGYDLSAVEHTTMRLMKMGFIYFDASSGGFYPVPWQKIVEMWEKK